MRAVSPFRFNLSAKCKKCSLFVGLLSALVSGLALYSWIMPKYLEFQDMSAVLVPSWRQESSKDAQYCDHAYEKQWSTKTIRIFENITDWGLNQFALSTSVTNGGAWSPDHCLSKYRVNIVVPYRARSHQLWTFLHYIHRFLAEQLIEYRVFVVEQSEEQLFNRAKLLNIGFVEAQKRYPTDCYIFHDVDLLPRSLNNMYACSSMPRHLSSAIDVLGYQLPYRTNFGGVFAMTSACFRRINGHSNLFFGWGGEDDDLYYRTRAADLEILRFVAAVSNYTALKHAAEKPNPTRHQLLKKSKKSHLVEGLNSLNYTLLAYEQLPLYTRFLKIKKTIYLIEKFAR